MSMAIRDRIKELRRVPAGELRANPRNFRKHGQAQREAFAGVLKKVGLVGAALGYDDGNGLILLDGHMRASTVPPETLLPVLVLDVDNEEDALAILATFDTVGDMATVDGEALESLLAEIDLDGSVESLLQELTVDAGMTSVQPHASRDSVRGVKTGSIIRLALAIPDLHVVERALQATGVRNRGEALVSICQEYLDARSPA